MSYLLSRKNDDWTREISEKPRPRRKVRVLRSHTVEPYLDDYRFFALSPVYVHAGVGYSMPDQFEMEAGPQDRLIIDYQRTVIGGMGTWGKFVEGIAHASWEPFCHYLSTVMFFSVERKVAWQIWSADINVEGTAPRAIVDPSQLPMRLKVFLPDGNMGRLCVKAGCPAKLWWDKPHPRMIEAANAVLACKGKIDNAC